MLESPLFVSFDLAPEYASSWCVSASSRISLEPGDRGWHPPKLVELADYRKNAFIF
jgi:hypothetical protein